MHANVGGLAVTSRHREAVREYLSASLWVMPSLALIGALLLGSALSLVDVPADSPLRGLMFQGTADDARTLLIGISATMITVIALTLGLTVVALQLSSTQFSPRLLRNFLRVRSTQVVLSIFVATFGYAAAGLYTVGISAGSRTAAYPRLAVTGAITLLFASLGVLVYFADRLAHSIQIDSIMDVVERNTLTVIEAERPGEFAEALPEPPERAAAAVPAPVSGYVQSMHPEDLVPLAAAENAIVRIVPRVGEHVVAGTPLAWVWHDGDGPAPDPARFAEPVATTVRIAFERTMVQDAPFGLRQLVDIALKALSPAVNDPYTAVMAVDRLTVLMAALARRPAGNVVHRDAAGTVRVGIPAPAFADYLDLACGQIRRYGAVEPQVVLALLRLLRTTAGATSDPARRALLSAQVEVILADATRAVRQPEDLDLPRAEASEMIRALAPPG